MHVFKKGGQESLRPTWSVYYVNTQAVIMVVDSTDKERTNIVKEELFRLLTHEVIIYVYIAAAAAANFEKNSAHFFSQWGVEGFFPPRFPLVYRR